MDKEKKKDDIGKILSELQHRLQMMKYFAFVESVKSFERTNGRKPTWDEKENLAKILHMNLDDLCALLKKFPLMIFAEPLD